MEPAGKAVAAHPASPAIRAVSVESAALMYGLGKTTIREAIRAGTLKSYRVGRRILLKISDLETFLERNSAAAR